jgi:hypothetical protein
MRVFISWYLVKLECKIVETKLGAKIVCTFNWISDIFNNFHWQ